MPAQASPVLSVIVLTHWQFIKTGPDIASATVDIFQVSFYCMVRSQTNTEKVKR